MPELPEVENARQVLDAAVGRTIATVDESSRSICMLRLTELHHRAHRIPCAKLWTDWQTRWASSSAERVEY